MFLSKATSVHKTKALSNFFTLVFLLFSIAGCMPPKSDLSPESGVPQNNTATLITSNKTVTACEQSLRQDMKNKTIALETNSQINEEIMSYFKNSLNASTKTSYQTVSLDNQYNQLNIAYESKNVSITYELKKLSSSSKKGILELTVELESHKNFDTDTLTQTYLIDKNCKKIVTQTTRTQLTEKSKNIFTKNSTTTYIDGGKKTEPPILIMIPEGITLSGSEPNSFDLDSFISERKEPYYTVTTLGVIKITLKPTGSTKTSEFGQNFNFQKYSISISSLNEEIDMQMTMHTDPSSKVSLQELNNKKTWTIPLSIWDNIQLGEVKDISSLVKYNLPKDYLKTNNTITLTTNKALTYAHYTAYWNVLNTEKTNENKLILTQEENSEAQFNDEATSEDLAESDMIQTSLPEVQMIIKNIQSQSTDRFTQIQLVLQYLKDHYAYDHEMLENNVIRPLKTSEALERKKGVCQHYAVLFTTLTRALNIPSRTVLGYLLSGDTIGGHAWNEVEISPHVWKVIEPQNPSSLTQMRTRYYIPVSRAYFLESSTYKNNKYMIDFATTEFKIDVRH